MAGHLPLPTTIPLHAALWDTAQNLEMTVLTSQVRQHGPGRSRRCRHHRSGCDGDPVQTTATCPAGP